MTEGNKKTDLLLDIAAIRANTFPDHMGIEYLPSWGANLTRLIQLAEQKVSSWERAGVADKTLSIDVMVVWNANELIGERGLFLNPNYKASSEWYRKRPHTAQGTWAFIGPKILREIATLCGHGPSYECHGPLSLLSSS